MRKVQFRIILVAGVAAIAFAGGSEARAAKGADNAGDTLAPKSNGETEEIIVQARRQDEIAQDVPISLNVVSNKELARYNITNAADLTKYVPGLTANQRYSSEQTSFAIRGFSQELRTSATVGSYFAEVVAPRGGNQFTGSGEGANPSNLFDLENVQVLKGPQGTLFGRNTTGGAVLLQPKRPTDKFEGYLEGSYGNYSMHRIQGVINIPASSTFKVRFGVDHMKRDGVIKNVTGVGTDRFADVDYIALRGSALWEITPDIENYTVGSYFYTDHQPEQVQVYAADPAVGFGAFASGDVQRLQQSGDFYQVASYAKTPQAYTKIYQVINHTTFQISDNIRLKNIFSYSDSRQKFEASTIGGTWPTTLLGPLNFFPPDTFIFTPQNNLPEGQYSNWQRNFTEELQVSGTSLSGRLKWQAGTYFEKSTPPKRLRNYSPSFGSICNVDVDIANVRCLASPASSLNDTTLSTKFTNLGIYAQGTYDLTDALHLTAGIRYSKDKSEVYSQLQSVIFTPDPTPLNPVDLVAPQGRICGPGYTGLTNCAYQDSRTTQAPTWTLNVAYDLSPGIMTYATYSRGYRQGGVVATAQPGFNGYDAEKLDSYEIGLKTQFRGPISGTFNVAGFYSNFANQQIQASLIDANPTDNRPLPLTTTIINAGSSHIYGAELDSTLTFYHRFRLNGTVTYLNTKVKDLTVPQNILDFGYVASLSAQAGGVLSYSPKLSAAITGTLLIPIPKETGDLSLGATYRHVDRYQTAATGPLATAVNQLDLFLDWSSIAGRPLDLGLWAQNVTNQNTVVSTNGLLGSLGYDSRSLGRPRFYGARLRVHFGSGTWN